MKISDIQKYDSKRMYEAYEKWPEIAQENYFVEIVVCCKLKKIFCFVSRMGKVKIRFHCEKLFVGSLSRM